MQSFLSPSLQLIGILCLANVAVVFDSQAEAPRVEASQDQRLLPEYGSTPLFWHGEEKVAGFRNMIDLAPSRAVAAGDTVLELPEQLVDLNDLVVRHEDTSLALPDLLAQQSVVGLIVVKNGKIAFERYRLGNSRDTRWISFSVAKSVVAMLVGAAVQDGYIKSIDEKVTDYLPRLKGSSYDQSSISNLLQMASGVQWNEDYADPKSDVASANYATIALYEYLRHKSREAEPGEVFNYNTGETNLVGTLLRSAIGNNLATYLSEKVWRPFGMESDAYWQLTEPGGGEFGGCCINATLRDYARLGLFALANGVLSDGTRILPEQWMAESTTPSKGFEGYGYLWWLNADGSYEASGIFGQGIYINVAQSIVIAIHGARDEASNDNDWELQAALYKAIVDALRD